MRSLGEMDPSLSGKATYATGSATTMSNAGDLKGRDVCIVDPPRKGLDEEVVEALLAPDGPDRLIYVSCGFNAFKRDFDALTKFSADGNHYRCVCMHP
jgi:tRNA/tmRNA/rRNA uracil-C5-methylase (TrmA/RlmC/RlmD family)